MTVFAKNLHFLVPVEVSTLVYIKIFKLLTLLIRLLNNHSVFNVHFVILSDKLIILII